MNNLLPFFILILIIGHLLSLIPENKKENSIFGISIATIGIHLLGMIAFTTMWAVEGFPANYFYKGPVLYQSGSSEFSIDLYYDRISAVYAVVSGILTFLVAIFSRYYMHREKGFKRFFNNVLFFYLGINIILFSGNFETLFVGWEIIGITSFFLIGFYRDRYLPVKNALKVVSIYRVADICLLLAIWLCHHAFEKGITFLELSDLTSQHSEAIDKFSFQILIPGIFLIAALVKSAQFPFSSWLPRAMEGPTTSSAIFYGSLSVHMGIFLMLRTEPMWEGNMLFKGIIIFFGLITCFIASTIARVQSSVKTQIAYSSIAQIGLIFIEVALGWDSLALLHFMGNAFLRTYQLLVSPSVLNYLIHEQFFHFVAPQHDDPNSFMGRIKLTFYTLGIKEWNLDAFMYRLLWQPLKKLGKFFSFISLKLVLWIFVPIFLVGLVLVHNQELVPRSVIHYFSEIFAFVGFIMIARAFIERESAATGWFLIIMNQLFTSLSIGFNEQFSFDQIYIYLSGIIVSGIIGYLCLKKLTDANESISLNGFQGHSFEHPRLTIVFLAASLGLSGFPISPTFIGEDLLIGHIYQNQYVLTTLTTLNLILDGLAIFRIYSRLFLGPHTKGYHEVADRAS